MAQAGQQVQGSVSALWRYPVKSMPGEAMPEVQITRRGVLGDRLYALVDMFSGKVASAKHPRKWSRLLECQAAYVEPPQRGQPPPPVEITLPDGLIVTSDQSSIHQALSEALGRDVLLLGSAPGLSSYEKYWQEIEGMPYQNVVTEEPLLTGPAGETFFDGASVHLLTTSALRQLQARYPAGRFDARRFRPNIVIDLAPDAQEAIESAWIERTLAIGDEVRLSVVAPTVRCVMTTLPQGDLPGDPEILRTVGRHARFPFGRYGALPCMGVYAEVVTPGVIRCGDPIRLVEV
jgi:uncharacterized protein YcbX